MNAKARVTWRMAVGVACVQLLVGSVGAARADGRDSADLSTNGTAAVESVRGGWESVGPEGGRIEALVQCPSNPRRMYAVPYRLGLYRSDDRGESWWRVASDLPLDTYYHALAVSPADDDVLLLAEQTGGEVLRSEDGGRTWTRHGIAGADWVGVNALRFDPHDPDHVLMAVSGEGLDECSDWFGPVAVGTDGLYRSTDGGRSWSPVLGEAEGGARMPSGCPVRNPLEIAFDPGAPGTMLVGGREGLYRTTDCGRTWARVVPAGNRPPFPGQDPEPVPSVSFCRSDPSRVWAVQKQIEPSWDAKLLRSDDGGLTFLTIGMLGFYPDDIAVAAHPFDADQALVGITTGPETRLYRATQSGFVPTPVYRSSLEGGERISALAFDSEVPVRAYLSTTNDPYQRLSLERDVAMTRFGLVRSDDGGQSWAPGMRGIRGPRIAGLGDDADGTIWVHTGGIPFGGALYRAESPGDAWTAIALPLDWRTHGAHTVFHVDDRASGVLSRAGSGTPNCEEGGCSGWHSMSSDGGTTWSDPWFPGINPGGCCDCPVPERIVTGGGAECYVWVGGSDCGVAYVAADGSYEAHGTGFMAAGAAMDPGDPLRMFAVDSGSPGTVYLTTDGGATWEPTAGQPGGSAIGEGAVLLSTDRGVDLLMDPDDPERLVVIYETAGVWETTDSGESWRRIPTGTGSSAVVAADWDPRTDRVFLATREDGVWVTGLGWTGDDLPTRSLVDVDFLPRRNAVLLGTHHAGVFALSLPETPAGSEAAPSFAAQLRSPGSGSGAEGAELRLSAVAPNPFARSATIRYELPRPSRARIGIHDVTGRLVVTLRDAPTAAGSHSVVWDGRDGSGARVAAGTYFVRVDAGLHARTRKVVYRGEN